MIGLEEWDPLSQEVLVETLVVQYGWVLAFAMGLGVACRRGREHWQHLPVLCWALIAARHHLDFWWGCAISHGPSIEMYWVMAYENMLGLPTDPAADLFGEGPEVR